MFIAPHRKKCSMSGYGIQYIPGHSDSFTDFVIDKYVGSTSKILDLGGGGFRFAIPAGQYAESVDVVDNDALSLNVDLIINHANQNNSESINAEAINNIHCYHADIFEFLTKSESKYDLITSFRVIHFLSETEIELLFSLVNRHLADDGYFILSFITPYINADYSGQYNEIFLETDQIGSSPIERKFKKSAAAGQIMQDQNLSTTITVIDNYYLAQLCRRFNFRCHEGPIQSTRIVEGFVLVKNSNASNYCAFDR